MCNCKKKSAGSHPGDGFQPFKSNFLVQFCLVLLKGYRYFISPLFPPTCRYTPTCSQYAVDAVSRYGIGRGLLISFRRLFRCHPFAKGGYDPVE